MFLITKDGKPVEALRSFVQRHGIDSSQNDNAAVLSGVIQEYWLRKTDHQYQIPGGPPKEEDLVLLKELGMIEEIPAPKNVFFEGALVLGGTLLAVRKRILFLKEQYEKGAQVEEIYLLGGARVLNSETESAQALDTPLPGLPFRLWDDVGLLNIQTEAAMMSIVFIQSDLPEAWEGTFIDTSLREDGSVPNTTDTVKTFLRQKDLEPGEYLVVSGQPYVARQTLNVRSCMPSGFSIIPSGYEATPTLPLKAFLDEVARLLYEEVRLFETS